MLTKEIEINQLKLKLADKTLSQVSESTDTSLLLEQLDKYKKTNKQLKVQLENDKKQANTNNNSNINNIINNSEDTQGIQVLTNTIKLLSDQLHDKEKIIEKLTFEIDEIAKTSIKNKKQDDVQLQTLKDQLDSSLDRIKFLTDDQQKFYSNNNTVTRLQAKLDQYKIARKTDKVSIFQVEINVTSIKQLIKQLKDSNTLLNQKILELQSVIVELTKKCEGITKLVINS